MLERGMVSWTYLAYINSNEGTVELWPKPFVILAASDIVISLRIIFTQTTMLFALRTQSDFNFRRS